MDDPPKISILAYNPTRKVHHSFVILLLQVAEIMGEELGWSEEEVKEDIAEAEEFICSMGYIIRLIACYHYGLLDSQ